MNLENHIEAELLKRRNSNLYRTLQNIDRRYIDFTSNDYLGIGNNNSAFDSFLELLLTSRPPAGSGGSRLLGGSSEFIAKLESYLAELYQCAGSLYFNSGYQANLALLSCIASRNDTFIYDQFCHASLKEGIRSSLAQKISFLHNDLNDLEKKIKKARGKIFIITESVFSMEGYQSPLQNIDELAEKFNAYVIVDEAHAAGLYGKNHTGLAQNMKRCICRIITFGKAYGTQGAALLFQYNKLRDFVINFARAFIYTTAPSPVLCLLTLHNVKYAHEHPSLQKQLLNNISYFQQQAQFFLPSYQPTGTAIQKIIIPDRVKLQNISTKLKEQGILCQPIFPPTVPEQSERLRIIIHSFNNPVQVDFFFNSLKKLF